MDEVAVIDTLLVALAMVDIVALGVSVSADETEAIADGEDVILQKEGSAPAHLVGLCIGMGCSNEM